MAKFEAGVWLTEDETLIAVVAEKSGKQRKVMLLTNRRLALIQHINGGWRFIEDRLWKDFDSVGIEHRNWGNSFMVVHFNPKLNVEEGLWTLNKVDKKQATPAYKEMKNRELKRRETPPKKPPAKDTKKDELPKDARYVFNIDSKACKAEALMKEKAVPPASSADKASPPPAPKEDKPGDKGDQTPPEPKEEKEKPAAPAEEAEPPAEKDLHAEGQQALLETVKGFVKDILKKN